MTMALSGLVNDFSKSSDGSHQSRKSQQNSLKQTSSSSSAKSFLNQNSVASSSSQGKQRLKDNIQALINNSVTRTFGIGGGSSTNSSSATPSTRPTSSSSKASRHKPSSSGGSSRHQQTEKTGDIPRHSGMTVVIGSGVTSVSSKQQQDSSARDRGDNTTNNTGKQVCPIHPQIQELRRHFLVNPPALSHFEMKSTVGTGTFGRVRVVRLKQGPQTPMALKILRKARILELQQVEHVKSEKNILTSISHPFVINLLASFHDQHRLYMVMEYVNGGELFSYLRNQTKLGPSEARFYTAEIVLAFEYLHDLRIAYRDLKPENLLLDTRGHIKMTDFGFAKVVEDRTWTVCGTPEYLAPEIIQHKGHGKSVDWWALGILLFEMLVGSPPFYDDEPMAIYKQVIEGIVSYPEWMDPRAKDLIKKLLTQDRTKRYGCLKYGAEDVKRHKFFHGISWTDCYNRNLKAPYIPKVNSLDDTSMFDTYDESDGEETRALTDEENALFADF